MRHALRWLALALLLPACAGAAAPQVSAVLFKFSAAAQQQMQDEPRFTARALRDAVVEELTTRGLLGEASGGGLVDLQVDDFSLRNTSNVVVFGSIATAGKLGAVLEVQAAGGGLVKKAEVRVEVSLTLRKDGENPDELRKLYRRFAQAVADEIAGTNGSVEADGSARP
jgi:hypothetical protein